MKSLRFWTKEGFEVTTEDIWNLEERKNSVHTTSGNDESGTCTYTYNELGYRGDSIYKGGFRILVVGDSHTEGVGVNDNETWSHQLSRMIPNGVDLNGGFGGRSNDYIARTIVTMLKTFRPDLVLVMYTYPTRKEYYTKIGDLQPFHVNPWGYFKNDTIGKIEHESYLTVSHDENDMVNWYKNHLLITHYLKSHNTPFVWNGCFLNDKTINEENRFDGEYDNFFDKSADKTHAGPIHNKLYAERLYKFLLKNDYLPNV
jgi:hypothetical protein